MRLEKKNLTITLQGTLPEHLERVPFLAIKKKILGDTYELSIAFVGPTTAASLNSAHRGKDYTPNTLSFSLSKQSGEIIMCLSAIKKEYKQFDMSLRTYLIFLLIHSMLHLKGYAHGGTMERKEKQLLKLFA